MTISIMTMFILYCGNIQEITTGAFYSLSSNRAKCVKELSRCYQKDPSQDSVAIECIEKSLNH